MKDDAFQQLVERQIEKAEVILNQDGWFCNGCDIWIDPQTGLKHGVILAYEINRERTGHSI